MFVDRGNLANLIYIPGILTCCCRISCCGVFLTMNFDIWKPLNRSISEAVATAPSELRYSKIL